jgi:serine/threonine protein kinase
MYLKSFPKRERIDLRSKFPGASDEALDLLQRILVFNPYFRLSIQECLEHPYLKGMRQAQLESIAGKETILEVDKASKGAVSELDDFDQN